MKNRLFLTGLMLMLFSVTGVQAATITVTTLSDALNLSNGDCTLREAITAANNNAVVDACSAGSGVDDIVFTTGLTGTIVLSESLPAMSNSIINITGSGITLDAGNTYQIITISSTKSTISGLSFINANGGAIIVNSVANIVLQSCVVSNNSTDTVISALQINDGASVTIKNCLFENNTTTGAISNNGGAIDNAGQLIIRQSTLRLNRSSGNGGAINNRSTGDLKIYNSAILNNISDRYSGGIESRGWMFISNSRIEENHASSYAAIYSFNSSPVEIEQTNISNNTSSSASFALRFQGTLILRGSTISGNMAQDVGATMGGILVVGDASIINSTISGNNGPGIQISAGTPTPLPHASLTNVTITNNGTYGITNYKGFDSVNSIIANNGTSDCIISTAVTSNGGNINGDSTCGFNQSTDQSNVDPGLEPLKDNAGTPVGPTGNQVSLPTHALWVTSLAMDRGDNINCPTVDQRGVIRPIDGDFSGGAICDIGAYELANQAQISVTDSLTPNDDLLLTYNSQLTGTSTEAIITLSNKGSTNLGIGSPSLKNITAGFSVNLSGGTNPCYLESTIYISSLDSCTISVTFNPVSVGNYSSQLLLTPNDTGEDTAITINMTGKGVEPEIDVTDSLGINNDLYLPFGELLIGESVQAIVTINNVNSTFASDLNVSAIQITGTDVSDFALDVNAGSTPCGATTTTIIPGNSCTVGISFTPQTEGVKSASLKINSDDQDEATINIAISATGTAAKVAAATSGGGGGCTLKSGTPAPFDPLWPFMFIVAAFYKVRKYTISKQEN